MRIAPLLLLAPLAGCWMPSYVIGTSASDWYEVAPCSLPVAEVVKISREILLRQGYRLPPEQAGQTRLETDWVVFLSSHWREGFRTKVEVVVERTGEGRTIAAVRAFREVNEDGKNPSMLDSAIWGNASLDEKHKPKMGEPAMRVQQLLKIKLEGKS